MIKTKKSRQPICFIFGTRPEIIKISPLINECLQTNTPFITIHTGQHYSENMDQVFWQNLALPPVTYNLQVGSGTHGAQTARMLEGIEKLLIKEKPRLVIVQGDTNSVLAGSIAAAKLDIPIAHVEAGLRSYDRKMPEEINRVIAGTIASMHFVPTSQARENLLKEGINNSQIYLTGNTIVDALYRNRQLAKNKSKILSTLQLKKNSYMLVTVHRPENSDSQKNMKNIILALATITNTHKTQLIWPIHPRTKKQVEMFGLEPMMMKINNLTIIDPVGFFDMIQLLTHSQLVITDSGGIQEEACILGIPCVTLRKNTERPESVSVGANILAGSTTPKIVSAVSKMLSKHQTWQNPFGDGTAAQKIMDAINHS